MCRSSWSRLRLGSRRGALRVACASEISTSLWLLIRALVRRPVRTMRGPGVVHDDVQLSRALLERLGSRETARSGWAH